MAGESNIKTALVLNVQEFKQKMAEAGGSFQKFVSNAGKELNTLNTPAVPNLNNQLEQTNTALKTTTGSSHNLTMAMMQLGYGVGDLSMITTNFRFALMGISNNLPFVIQGLMGAKKEADSMNKSFGSMIMQSIRGPAGILLAVNAVVLALQILPELFAETTKAIEEQKEEVKKLAEEYQKLSSGQIKNQISDLEKQLADFEGKHPIETETAFDLTRIYGGLSPIYKRPVSDAERFGDDVEAVKLLKEKISLLDRELLYKGLIDDAEIRIRANQEKLSSLNKENFALIVSGAESYEDAKKTLDGWIEADKKIIEKRKEEKDLLDKIITSDNEILKKIGEIDKLLARTNISERERNLLLEQRKKLYEELNELVQAERSTTHPSSKQTGAFGPGQGPQPSQQTGARTQSIKEEKDEVDALDASYQVLEGSISSGTSALIRQLSSAHSWFQILIADIAAAIVQMYILAAIKLGFDILTGGASSAVPIGPASPIGKARTGFLGTANEGIQLSRLSNIPNLSTQKIQVEVVGDIEGDVIRLSNKRAIDFRKKFGGDT